MKIIKTNKIKLIASLLFAIVATGIVSAFPASAWGPERTTFTMAAPATYPSFNSITDNPTIGDERNFVRIAEKNDGSTYTDEVKIEPGKQYEVYIYYHNNASATFNDSAHNYSGVALEARLSSAFTTTVTPEQRGAVTATITSSNTVPNAVWDDAFMTADTTVHLHYVPGTAKIYNIWDTNGSILPSSLFSKTGTFLGTNALNGVLFGCEEYHGVVVYTLQAENPVLFMDKTVSADGNEFSKGIKANPGDELTYKITLKNDGNVALNNVTIWDKIPEGMSLVSGSVKLFANDSTTGDSLSDNLTNTGYNLGTLGTGNEVRIIYKVKVDRAANCDEFELTNTASAIYDGGNEISDSVVATVNKKTCGKEETPEEYIEKHVDDKPSNPSTPSEIPNTGPAEVILASIIILVIVLGIVHWLKVRYAVQETTRRATRSRTAQKQATVSRGNSNIAKARKTAPKKKK